jgi:hypothetical protein
MNTVNALDNARAWAARLVSLYPQITEVVVGGSLLSCWPPHPCMDLPIVVCLSDDAYATMGEDVCRLEQQITYDPAIRFERMNFMFLHPGGGLSGWDWPPGEPPAWVLEKEPWERDYLLAGVVLQDDDVFWRDFKPGIRLYPIAAPEAGAEYSFTGRGCQAVA